MSEWKRQINALLRHIRFISPAAYLLARQLRHDTSQAVAEVGVTGVRQSAAVVLLRLGSKGDLAGYMTTPRPKNLGGYFPRTYDAAGVELRELAPERGRDELGELQPGELGLSRASPGVVKALDLAEP